MAGIGFVLKKMLDKKSLLGFAQAYFHAILSTSGPWLFTVAALGAIYSLTRGWEYYGFIDEFRAINLYNFSFSLVFTAPYTLIGTRFLADTIYKQDLVPAAPLFFGLLALSTATSAPFVIGFYLLYTSLPPPLALLAIFQFYLISALWISSIFLSTLKLYRTVSLTFLLGMALSIAFTLLAATTYTAIGVLFGFSIGIAAIVGTLIALFLHDYPATFANPFAFAASFKSNWKIALGGFFYSMGIWVDKWIMWFSKEAVSLPSGLILYPYYDSAMFVAYLTVIPAMAMFMLTQETSFYEKYFKFYHDIQEHINYKQIVKNQKALFDTISESGRNIIILQICICTFTILIAPFLFKQIGMNFIQLAIFRYGVLGASFHLLSLLIFITLSYLEDRKNLLALEIYFFTSNGLFTAIAMQLGFSYYGYGYFLASLTTFVLASLELKRFYSLLPYHAFISTNTSIR